VPASSTGSTTATERSWRSRGPAAGSLAPRSATPDPLHRSLANGALSAHARATSWISARLTLRGVDWVSDREMRSQAAWQVSVIWNRPGHHRPDLGYTTGQTRVAIEVELTAKSAQRTSAIIAGYEHQLFTGRLGGLIYVTEHPGVRKLVERTARRVHINPDRFRMIDLEELKDETRQLAEEATPTPAPTPPEAQRA